MKNISLILSSLEQLIKTQLYIYKLVLYVTQVQKKHGNIFFFAMNKKKKPNRLHLIMYYHNYFTE